MSDDEAPAPARGAYYACRAAVGGLDVAYVSPDRDRVVHALRRLLDLSQGRGLAAFGRVVAATPEEAKGLVLAPGSRWAWGYFAGLTIDDAVLAAIGLARTPEGEFPARPGDSYRVGATQDLRHDALIPAPGTLYRGHAWGAGGRPGAWFTVAGRMMAEFQEALASAGDPPPPGGTGPGGGFSKIAEERARQAADEGYDPKNDDGYTAEELVRAAAGYLGATGPDATRPADWPFAAREWAPEDRVANLVRAGALIAAEIDRLGRLQAGAEGAMGPV